MIKRYTRILLLLFLASNFLYAQFGLDQQLVKTESFISQQNAYKSTTLKIALKLSIDQSWHINSNNPNDDFLIPTELSIISADSMKLSNIKYPGAKEINFKFSDKPVSVYEGEVFIFADIVLPANINLGTSVFEIKLNYQACNDQSCMPPNEVIVKDSVQIVENNVEIIPINSEKFSAITQIAPDDAGVSGNEDSVASTLASSGIFLSIIIVFLGGLALNLTPCVYPLIPITVGYFGGQSEGRTSRLFILGLVYVLGMALTYSVIGVVTSLSGAVFGALLQNPLVIIAIALVLFALSLSMFGVYEFKLPDSWVAKAGSAKTGYFGSFFMGLTLGIVAAPCIGPFVLGLLTVVAAKGDVLYGFLMFFFLALGLGTPYLILAMFSGKIKNLPRAGFWMEGVKHIFGFLLVGMAIYFLLPILPEILSDYLLPVFMIVAALYLLIFDKMGNDVKGFRIFKYVFALAVIAVSAYILYPTEKQSPAWQYYTDDIYESALKDNSKMIIDFYADWCIPCKELDALTFSDPRVIEESKKFTTIKVDMTKTVSDETERIREKFNIRGMPTLLIIDSEGNEIERLTGFINADEFLKLIQDVK